MTPSEFQARTGIDDLTLGRFQAYADLLVKWQRRINLVGPRTLPDMWHRHMLDSAQLLPLIPPSARVLVDLGSGAGFPGLVLAILGVPEVHLIESDNRKCAFLREAARITQAESHLHVGRIEHMEPFQADIVTARALSPIKNLLEYAEPFLGPNTVCLFPKGKTVEDELTDSEKNWYMTVQRVQSATDPSGVIVKLEGVSRHHGLDR